MKLCLDCRRVWPSHSLICGTCRKSFGGRLCVKNHLSPAGAICCTTCGSRKLLPPARFINLSLPVHICAWIIGLLALKLLIANLGLVLSIGWWFAETVGSFVFGGSLTGLICSLFHTALILGMVWLAFRKILGKDSLATKGAEKAATHLFKGSLKAAVWLGKAFYRWVTTRPKSPALTDRGGRREE